MTDQHLDFDPATIAVPCGHFIGGQLIDGGDPLIEVRRPSDGAVMGLLPNAGAATVDHAVRNAQQAWESSGWGTRSPRERARVMLRWADLILEDIDTLARLEAVGSTRPIRDARNHEIPFTAQAIRFFAECADKFGGDVVPTSADTLGMIVPEPYGVVGAITPWNFPLSMASWKCGPALAAGNALVLKPSELTPYSTVRLAELAIRAGIPAGIFNVVQGTGVDTGAALVRHPLIRKVSFTGSTATGASVMTDAAHHGMKPVTLELGGKSPQLVFDDAGDLASVADRIVRGFTSNAGQACVAGTRLVVHRRIAQPLLEQVQLLLAPITPGLTWKGATRYAPLISARQAEKVHTAVQDTLASGAQAISGANYFPDTGDGYYYQPTVLTGVTPDSVALREEIFGPVLTVQTFEDEDEGIALARHPVYGLAAGVHTLNINRALRATRQIAAGTVWVNRYGRSGDFIIPTGGFQGSGIGKDLGRQAFEANLRYKSVLVDIHPQSGA